MSIITEIELEKALKLYSETRNYQYGSIRYRAAKNRYDHYVSSLAEKYNCQVSYVNSRVITERRRRKAIAKLRGEI